MSDPHGRHAWFQCASGASGDMLLGALLDAGASLSVVRAAVAAIDVERVAIRTEPVRRGGMAALKAHVNGTGSHHHRDWSDVRRLIGAAGPGLAEPARDRALAVFETLAVAEGRAHGVTPEQVHFHEVGALDAIADVVGVCAAVHDLGLEWIGADTVAVGSGTVDTSHGRLAVPVPAVVELLAPVRAPVTAGAAARELCTPTGAALLATLVDRWGPLPPMRMHRSGIGAGTAEVPQAPNVLRVILGEFTSGSEAARPAAAQVLAANVDDLDPRVWPHVIDQLMRAGADDVWFTPILMKKGRPAHTVSALTTSDRAATVHETMVRETSTIGVRSTPAIKHALARTEGEVEVAGQRVRVKHAWLGQDLVNSQPEYDDLLAATIATGHPLKDLLERAQAAATGRG